MVCVASSALANEFVLLSNHRDALEARLSMLRLAEAEIALAVYDMDASTVPMTLLSLLNERARQGIKVRVIIDGFLSRLPLETHRSLADAGVEVKIFHPLFKGQPGSLNRRMHSKLMVVDRKMMIIGSRNLTDPHFGLGESSYVNCDAVISGASCDEAARYFDSIWASNKVSTVDNCLAIRERAAKLNASDVKLDNSMNAERLLSRFENRVDDQVGTVQRTNSCSFCPDELCLLYDPNLEKSDGLMAKKIISLVDSAKNSIVIESPYPAFSDKFVDALDRATCRGVSVALLTNSLRTTDQVIVYAAYQNQKRSLLKRGVKLLEYSGSDHLHAKGMVIDDELAVFGSYNFDARAEGLNLELCMVMSNTRATAIISQSMLNRHAESILVDQHWIIDVQRDSGAKRRSQLRAYQLMAPLLRPLL